jgi:GNAT superfamily N-acetyltransferase
LELENITCEEIEPFFNSLGKEEKELLGIPLDYVLSADFICGVRLNNVLAGITGYIKSYRLIPSSFDVVASQFQGKGLGNELHQKRLEFARKHYSFAVSSIGKPEEHQASLHLYHKYGLKDFYRRADSIWLCISFNQRGKVICKLLPLIYFVFGSVNRLPLLGHALYYIYEYVLKLQHKRNRLRGQRKDE